MPEGPEIETERLTEAVSIALGAVAALTRSRAVWIGSLLMGAAGTALFIGALIGM